MLGARVLGARHALPELVALAFAPNADTIAAAMVWARINIAGGPLPALRALTYPLFAGSVLGTVVGASVYRAVSSLPSLCLSSTINFFWGEKCEDMKYSKKIQLLAFEINIPHDTRTLQRHIDRFHCSDWGMCLLCNPFQSSPCCTGTHPKTNKKSNQSPNLAKLQSAKVKFNRYFCNIRANLEECGMFVAVE
jgi:hypothetical protein